MKTPFEISPAEQDRAKCSRNDNPVNQLNEQMNWLSMTISC